MQKELIISQTKKWIVDVVVGCNFCPFAIREVKKESILFEVVEGEKSVVLKELSGAFGKMDVEAEIETTFIILQRDFSRFSDYLKLVGAAEEMVRKMGYEGVYQVASFHPGYLFAGSNSNDPANYTNRSPYPMLHILREESVSRAVDSYPGIENIPQRNMDFARDKGLAYMQRLRAACMESGD
jgi:uncharacterized protein